MVTEVWAEPQFGRLTDLNSELKYLEGLQYNQVPNAVSLLYGQAYTCCSLKWISGENDIKLTTVNSLEDGHCQDQLQLSVGVTFEFAWHLFWPSPPPFPHTVLSFDEIFNETFLDNIEMGEEGGYVYNTSVSTILQSTVG